VRVARDVHDGVVAVRIRDGGRLGWIQRSVAVVVHVHGPAGESRLARAVRAVGVQVVEHRSRDGGALRVAEVRAGEAGSGRDAHARISADGRRGARPGGLALLADGVGARLYAGDRVGAVARGGRARLARVADAVAVVIHVDGPAGETRLSAVAQAVGVQVLELVPADVAGRRVAEVALGDGGPGCECHVRVRAAARMGAHVAGERLLAHGVGAGLHA